MDEESVIQRVLHLWQVEHLSQRQIARVLGIGRNRVKQILKGKDAARPLSQENCA